jgi:protein-tyrosine kinase
MSRIHEALLRAEQERAAREGGSVTPSIFAPVSDTPGFADNSELSTMPASGGPFTLQNLLARTGQRQWQPDAERMLFFDGGEAGAGTEEFRTLRSRLYATRERMPLKTILVTSALPQEGKSFTSANLAQVMVRQHGRRALLIDADLRGPRLHQMLGTEVGPGLSEYLQEKNDEFSIMQRGPLENLFFIPGGSSIADPAELVGNGRLKTLLQRVEPLFDWIIIDSPPVIAVSDASVLAKACDGVLLVVRSHSTPSDVARKARQEFSEQVLLGVVLNGTRGDAAPYARYYYESYAKKEVPAQV